MLLEILDFLQFTIYYFVFIYNKIESHSLNHYKLMWMFSQMSAQPSVDMSHEALQESTHTQRFKREIYIHSRICERQAIAVT